MLFTTSAVRKFELEQHYYRNIEFAIHMQCGCWSLAHWVMHLNGAWHKGWYEPLGVCLMLAQPPARRLKGHRSLRFFKFVIPNKEYAMYIMLSFTYLNIFLVYVYMDTNITSYSTYTNYIKSLMQIGLYTWQCLSRF